MERRPRGSARRRRPRGTSSRRARAGASGRRRRTPRSASTGSRSGSPPSPGMPLITSLGERRPKRWCSFSPARPHQFARSGDLRRRVADHGRRPLDRVDLGDQRGVDQARPLEEVVVGPRRVLGSQPVADRVVLADEDRSASARSRARSPAPASGRAPSPSGSAAARPRGSAACRPRPSAGTAACSSELP